jgi:hypothetical protein
METNYICLFEMDIKDEKGEGYMIGVACQGSVEINKKSFKTAMNQYVGSPNSTKYRNKEKRNSALVKAKELLEKNGYTVKLGLKQNS